MFDEHPDLLRALNQGDQATGELDRVMRRIAHKHVSLGIRPEHEL